jgi:Zinc-ribbon, C4HC2 type
MWLASHYSFGSANRRSAIDVRALSDTFSKDGLFEPDVAKEKAYACRKNACLAQAVNESSISRIWALLSISIGAMYCESKRDSQSKQSRDVNSWLSSAIGGHSLVKIIRYLQKIDDIQSLATLVCVLGGCDCASILLERYFKLNDDQKHYQLSSTNLNRAVIGYADVLRRWGMLDDATEIMKYSKSGAKKSTDFQHDLKFHLECTQCHSDISISKGGIWCANCKDFPLRCSICNLAVRTTGSFCLSCGHGGHSSHIKVWFEQYTECPTGCGCRCADLTADSEVAVANEKQIEFLGPSKKESYTSKMGMSSTLFQQKEMLQEKYNSDEEGSFDGDYIYGYGDLS